MAKRVAPAVEVNETEVQRAAAFQCYARFESVDPSVNRYRAYLYIWQPDLWGGGGLIRAWGRLGSLGRSLTTHYPDRSSAHGDITAAVQRRFERGYVCTGVE